jgi:signal peptidase II
MRKILPWWGLAFLIAAFDQISKAFINATLSPTEPIVLTSWFNLVLAHNRGAAFSFLAQAAGWQRYFFSGIALLAVIFLSRLIVQHSQKPRFCLGLTLIMGGALGNLVDRVVQGTVTDFIEWHAGSYYWPAFNVADAAITVGATLLVWDSLRTRA